MTCELFDNVCYKNLDEEYRKVHVESHKIIIRKDLTIDNVYDIACTAACYYMQEGDLNIKFTINERINGLDDGYIVNKYEDGRIKYSCYCTDMISFLDKKIIDKIFDFKVKLLNMDRERCYH